MTNALRAGHRSGDALADRRADYAVRLAEDGDAVAAADLMRQALELSPGWTAGWIRLGGYLEAAGAPADAASVYRTALALDADDGHGAGLKLATLGLAPLPATAPAAFVRGLFDQYADGFDASLVDKLDYGVPEAIHSALRAIGGPDLRVADALDLGCGTGLMGERLRPITQRLTGVDLSFGMLAKARRKGCYDRLVEADIVGFGAGKVRADRYDLVTAADVLIYVGDLAPVFATVAALLRENGLFAFSVEAHEGEEPYVLRPSLRFAHSRAGVLAAAGEAGLGLRREGRLALRRDRGVPVDGFVFVFGGVGEG